MGSVHQCVAHLQRSFRRPAFAFRLCVHAQAEAWASYDCILRSTAFSFSGQKALSVCAHRALSETLTKKNKGSNVKAFMVKNYLSVFVNCMIENPAFDSQARHTPHHQPVHLHIVWRADETGCARLLHAPRMLLHIRPTQIHAAASNQRAQ